MVWDGSASMSTCSNSSRSGYRNSRCWSRHNSQFRSTRISLTTHMAERSPLLLCILPTKGASFVFATHCLLIFVHPCVLCMLKAQSTYVWKTTWVVDAQRFVWNSKRKFRNTWKLSRSRAKSRLHCLKRLCQWKIVKVQRQQESSELKQTSNIWLKGRISMRKKKR